VSRDSSIGMANRYQLEGPRIEARWRFSVQFRPAFRPNHSPLQSVPDLSGGKAVGALC
jgi:hypothetical protein